MVVAAAQAFAISRPGNLQAPISRFGPPSAALLKYSLFNNSFCYFSTWEPPGPDFWRHQGHPDANYKEQLCVKMIGLGGGCDQNRGIWPWRHQGHPDANYKKQLRLKKINSGRATRIGEYGPGGTKATLMPITRSSCVLKW